MTIKDVPYYVLMCSEPDELLENNFEPLGLTTVARFQGIMVLL
jgi:hypothetical protein